MMLNVISLEAVHTHTHTHTGNIINNIINKKVNKDLNYMHRLFLNVHII